MNKARQTLKSEYFDALYAADPDPWNFAASPYEQAKYRLTLNAMPELHYRSALEVGCSIGVLTRLLASRCDSVVAIDAAETPLIEARRRCADLPGVRFEQMFAPDEWPDGEFDLILLSEVVYYFGRKDVGRLADRVTRSLVKDGFVILVHWTGETNYPLSGDEAAALFIKEVGPTCVVERAERHQEFRLDVLSRK
ncbi:MAG: class I SAM-dependent methyltransferase [Acidobacteriaceae bacterium]|nr:class I SAM-dependent methyltransferase [Acidobacteriaceae bacterium]